jgi:ribosome-associated heat shock protein Hsp15
MPDLKQIRIDKFLWSVRIYKTRSIASEACRKGRILINDVPVKPSRIITRDEVVVVKKPPVTYIFRIIEPVENRVSAKLAEKYIEDLTPAEEKEKLELKHSLLNGYRDKGTGRPTKRERRDLGRFIDDFGDK